MMIKMQFHVWPPPFICGIFGKDKAAKQPAFVQSYG